MRIFSYWFQMNHCGGASQGAQYFEGEGGSVSSLMGIHRGLGLRVV